MLKTTFSLLLFFLTFCLISSCGDSEGDQENNLRGKILNCEGQEVNDAFVELILDSGRVIHQTDNNGNFSIDLSEVVQTEFDVRFVEQDNYNFSTATVNINEELNLDELEVCDSSEQYFYFELQTDTLSVTAFSIDEGLYYHKNGVEYGFQFTPENIPGFIGRFNYHQDIILNQDIIGAEADGWLYSLWLRMEGDYTFRFSDKGPLNQDNNETYITGSVTGNNMNNEPAGILSSAFRLNSD